MHSLERLIARAGVKTASRPGGKNILMKQQRHTVIRELVGKAPIASQDELRRKLAGRGFHVTQATLSRDIHELRLSKGPDGYSLSNGVDHEDESLPGIREVLESFGLEVRQAANLLVLITTTGGAQPIAAGIDYEDWPEVVGTIAGDDTVLMICPDTEQATQLRTRIEGYFR
jgi:transcriptional regulator of arginine metabolism